MINLDVGALEMSAYQTIGEESKIEFELAGRKSWHTYECESWHTYECVTPSVRTSHVAHMNESSHVKNRALFEKKPINLGSLILITTLKHMHRKTPDVDQYIVSQYIVISVLCNPSILSMTFLKYSAYDSFNISTHFNIPQIT